MAFQRIHEEGQCFGVVIVAHRAIMDGRKYRESRAVSFEQCRRDDLLALLEGQIFDVDPLRGAKASHRRGLLEIALWMPGGEIIELFVCQLHQHKITHASLCLRVNQAHHASITRTRRMACEQMRCAHRSHYCRHDDPKNNGPKMMNVWLALNQTQCYILYLALEATPP